MHLVFACLFAPALGAQFAGPLLSFPPGYAANMQITARKPLGPVPQGAVGILTSLNTGIDAAAKPFVGNFPTLAGVTMADDDFFVNPAAGTQCTAPIPYPQIGSHALCFSFLGVYNWHCQWESSYGIPHSGGCDAVIIDCTDTNRINRVIAKYDWIRSQAGTPNGPEINRVDINDYTQACVRHQCQGGPAPPALAVPVPRLYDDKDGEGVGNSSMIHETTSWTSYVVAAFCAFIVTLAGVAFTVRRRTTHHTLEAEQLELEDPIEASVE
jgi:hypothetical protein